ncbi:hypothetical protein GOV11_02295 [Candidatus Woesearchaeota archaeon]|nr:hypothetical protein [Candidatus Woesearchaeota archaeon]
MAKKATRYHKRKKKSKAREEQAHLRRAQFRKRQRNKKILNYSILTIIIIAAAYGIYVALDDSRPGEYDDFAKCITTEGAIMYGTDWCPHCQDQKRMFGRSFKYVNYINCDVNPTACQLAGVDSYPTWVFSDGVASSGVQDLAFLADKTGCET